MLRWCRGAECRGGGEVQRSREVAAGAGCRGAEEVQRWCRGGAEVVQRCRGGAEVQRWCRGGAEVVQSPGTQVVSAEVVHGAEEVGVQRCRSGDKVQ